MILAEVTPENDLTKINLSQEQEQIEELIKILTAIVKTAQKNTH